MGTDDIREIANCGGTLELIRNSKGAVSLSYKQANQHPAALFQVGVALDRSLLEYWPIRGVDMREPAPPSPMVSAFVVSDREGYFGRTCPQCQTYFRTSSAGEIIICPYCNHRNVNASFTTKNQLAFVDKIRGAYVEAFEGKDNVVIDLDKISSALPENRPAWAYSEEKQQNRYTCTRPKCRTSYDILGEYACCPRCGKRNSLEVITQKLEKLDVSFIEVDKALQDKDRRGTEWANLTKLAISEFEAMGRDIQNQLLLLPMTPSRKNELERLSFQNITKANTLLEQWLGIKLFAGLSEPDQSFLHKAFQRRHILTHSAGRVDQEYLNKSGDTSFKLYETIRINSNEVKRLIQLLETCSKNLFQGFESIQ